MTAETHSECNERQACPEGRLQNPAMGLMNTPPTKAGGFGLRLNAGLIGHPAD
jgi:hypothetical protein